MGCTVPIRREGRALSGSVLFRCTTDAPPSPAGFYSALRRDQTTAAHPVWLPQGEGFHAGSSRSRSPKKLSPRGPNSRRCASIDPRGAKVAPLRVRGSKQASAMDKIAWRLRPEAKGAVHLRRGIRLYRRPFPSAPAAWIPDGGHPSPEPASGRPKAFHRAPTLPPVLSRAPFGVRTSRAARPFDHR
jgi:hypothetical protein